MHPPEPGQPHPEERTSFARRAEQPPEQDQQRYRNAPQYGTTHYGAPSAGQQYGTPPDYGRTVPGYGGYAPAPVFYRPAPFGAALAVLALAGAGAGMVALPLNSYDGSLASDAGFVETRSFVSLVGGRSHRLYSALANFWWQWGVFVAFAALVLLICAVVLARSARALGWLIALVALAASVVQSTALAQSTDLRSGAQLFRGYSGSNFYDHSGVGVWVSLARFALLALAGAAIGVTRGVSGSS